MAKVIDSVNQLLTSSVTNPVTAKLIHHMPPYCDTLHSVQRSRNRGINKRGTNRFICRRISEIAHAL